MKYQILAITIGNGGNTIDLQHPFDMSADDLSQLGAKVQETFWDLGIEVASVRAVHRADVYEDWVAPDVPQELFAPEGLPRQRRKRT